MNNILGGSQFEKCFFMCKMLDEADNADFRELEYLNNPPFNLCHAFSEKIVFFLAYLLP